MRQQRKTVRPRQCVGCGGPVKCNHATVRVQFDSGDVDPRTRRPVMVNRTFEGLGTWRCVNGCAKRKVMVNRFTGDGKEISKKQVEAWPVTRPIAVKYA